MRPMTDAAFYVMCTINKISFQCHIHTAALRATRNKAWRSASQQAIQRHAPDISCSPNNNSANKQTRNEQRTRLHHPHHITPFLSLPLIIPALTCSPPHLSLSSPPCSYRTGTRDPSSPPAVPPSVPTRPAHPPPRCHPHPHPAPPARLLPSPPRWAP